jgi:FKBP-type peptidyl-prolyl cis-trans isomerase FkpA
MMQKSIRTLRLVFAALVWATAACVDTLGPIDPTEVTFAPSLNINLATMTKTPTGLYIQDEIVGTGAVSTRQSTVTIDFTGWLWNGNQFDGGSGRSVILGRANVIDGWNEGLAGMAVGGRRLLVVPYDLGYGSRGAANVPPFATLVYRVNLRDTR